MSDNREPGEPAAAQQPDDTLSDPFASLFETAVPAPRAAAPADAGEPVGSESAFPPPASSSQVLAPPDWTTPSAPLELSADPVLAESTVPATAPAQPPVAAPSSSPSSGPSSAPLSAPLSAPPSATPSSTPSSTPSDLPLSAVPSSFDFLLAADTSASQQQTALDDTARSLPPAAPLGTATPAAPLTRSGSLGLERHTPVAVPRTGIVDWMSLVLSVIAPPVGILAAIAAIVLGIRSNGFASTVAKIALAIGIVLSLVLGVLLYIANDNAQKTAAHDAIVASSVKYCAELKASPGTLSSPTYGFPGAQDTIKDSIAAIQKYQDFWTGLTSVAPAGIKKGTQSVATAAHGILTSVTNSRVFDQDGNTAQMEQVVSNSGINSWVSQYCN